MPAIADLLLTNGNVLTMDPARPRARSVAIVSGRVLSVGSEPAGPDGVRARERVDLRGATLLPGFQDGHVHPIHGGLRRLRCDLTEAADDGAGYAAAVAAYARRHPAAPWITGGRWGLPHFPGGLPGRVWRLLWQRNPGGGGRRHWRRRSAYASYSAWLHGVGMRGRPT